MPFAKQFTIQLLISRKNRENRKVFIHMKLRLTTNCRSQHWIAEQGSQARAKIAGRIPTHDDAGDAVLHDLTDSLDVGCHDGKACRHRLQDHVRHALPSRWEREDGTCLHDLWNVRPPSGEVDALAAAEFVDL